MKKEKGLTEKAVKKELRGYYYAGVHQYEGECPEDKFIDIVCCDQYGVSYESCYDGWDYIIRKVPDYEDVCSMESQIERLQELLSQEEDRIRSLLERVGEADKIIKYYAEKHGKLKACDYLNKWGVK